MAITKYEVSGLSETTVSTLGTQPRQLNFLATDTLSKQVAELSKPSIRKLLTTSRFSCTLRRDRQVL